MNHDQIKHNTGNVCLNELLTDCIVQTLNIANLKNQKIKLEAIDEYSCMEIILNCNTVF